MSSLREKLIEEEILDLEYRMSLAINECIDKKYKEFHAYRLLEEEDKDYIILNGIARLAISSLGVVIPYKKEGDIEEILKLANDKAKRRRNP